MIKVRLRGLMEELEDFIKYLSKLTDWEILHTSKILKDREPSNFYHVFVHMRKKRENE